MEPLEWTVEEPKARRLDRWLSERCPQWSRTRLRQCIDAGEVTVNGEQRPARYKLSAGDQVALSAPPQTTDTSLQPEAIALDIIREDDHILVVNKAADMVVHPAPGHTNGTLAGALLAHCGPSLREAGGEDRWGIVHRLDRQTTGLLVAAKTAPAYERLVAALAARTIHRHYVALVLGNFPESGGTIDRPIGRRASDRKRMSVNPDGRPARTHWQVLHQAQVGIALLGLRLETGRTHQIRVHLQNIGRPVLGDPEYGLSRARTMQEFGSEVRGPLARHWPERQMLHAARLAFRHPCSDDEIWDLQSPLPPEMDVLCEALLEPGWREALAQWLQAPLRIETLETTMTGTTDDDEDDTKDVF